MNWLEDTIKNCWHGDEYLSRVFWVYGYGIAFLFYLVDLFIAPGFSVARVLFLIVYLSWWGWNTVSIWNCAYNSSHVMWAYLARFMVIVGVFMAAYHVTQLFMPAPY